ncbi:alpha/beta hydrolase [Pseudonocardia sp. NPDC049635]|uniref:alpha/beta fold hydrolase n=1 Tax=Pseudonocardia sp. NPDC049635 TaxID=3155506 RepID=UPI0033D6CC8C
MHDDPPYDYRRAHLVLAGPAHAPTVVVLGGRHGCAATLTGLLELLAARYRVIGVDPPGEAGLGSGGRPNTDRLRDYGSWFDDLLTELAPDAPDGVTVLAHGFGAAVALAARPTSRVRGMVLLNPYGFVRPAPRSGPLTAMLGWRAVPLHRTARRVLSRLGGPSFVPPEALVDWLATVGRHVALSTTPPPRPELARRWRGTPVTVCVGEHDPLFGGDRLARAARRVLGASVSVVPGAGALLPYEQPDAVRVALGRHLREGASPCPGPSCDRGPGPAPPAVRTGRRPLVPAGAPQPG